MKKKEKIGLALLAGAALAAGIVYLFTSNRGKGIRKNVLLKGRKVVETLQELAKDLKCKEEKAEAVS